MTEKTEAAKNEPDQHKAPVPDDMSPNERLICAFANALDADVQLADGTLIPATHVPDVLGEVLAKETSEERSDDRNNGDDGATRD